MVEFYRKHESQITPVGLNFFQTEWEACVKETFHHVLSKFKTRVKYSAEVIFIELLTPDMREPSFEYFHRPQFVKAQKRYPQGQAFDK